MIALQWVSWMILTLGIIDSNVLPRIRNKQYVWNQEEEGGNLAGNQTHLGGWIPAQQVHQLGTGFDSLAIMFQHCAIGMSGEQLVADPALTTC